MTVTTTCQRCAKRLKPAARFCTRCGMSQGAGQAAARGGKGPPPLPSGAKRTENPPPLPKRPPQRDDPGPRR